LTPLGVTERIAESLRLRIKNSLALHFPEIFTFQKFHSIILVSFLHIQFNYVLSTGKTICRLEESNAKFKSRNANSKAMPIQKSPRLTDE
jgi:hypothetical protein